MIRRLERRSDEGEEPLNCKHPQRLTGNIFLHVEYLKLKNYKLTLQAIPHLYLPLLFLRKNKLLYIVSLDWKQSVGELVIGFLRLLMRTFSNDENQLGGLPHKAQNLISQIHHWIYVVLFVILLWGLMTFIIWGEKLFGRAHCFKIPNIYWKVFKVRIFSYYWMLLNYNYIPWHIYYKINYGKRITCV